MPVLANGKNTTCCWLLIFSSNSHQPFDTMDEYKNDRELFFDAKHQILEAYLFFNAIDLFLH
jgi:hypothetical protein